MARADARFAKATLEQPGRFASQVQSGTVADAMNLRILNYERPCGLPLTCESRSRPCCIMPPKSNPRSAFDVLLGKRQPKSPPATTALSALERAVGKSFTPQCSAPTPKRQKTPKGVRSPSGIERDSLEHACVQLGTELLTCRHWVLDASRVRSCDCRSPHLLRARSAGCLWLEPSCSSTPKRAWRVVAAAAVVAAMTKLHRHTDRWVPHQSQRMTLSHPMDLQRLRRLLQQGPRVLRQALAKHRQLGWNRDKIPSQSPPPNPAQQYWGDRRGRQRKQACSQDKIAQEAVNRRHSSPGRQGLMAGMW